MTQLAALDGLSPGSNWLSVLEAAVDAALDSLRMFVRVVERERHRQAYRQMTSPTEQPGCLTAAGTNAVRQSRRDPRPYGAKTRARP